MKCKQLALRVLSTAAVVTMVTSIAAPAFADAYGIATYGTYYVDQGSVTVEVVDGVHYVTQKDAQGNCITGEDGKTYDHYKDETDVILTNQDKTQSTKNTVTIRADKDSTGDKSAKVTLDGVNIDTRDEEDRDSPYVEGDAAMVVTGAGDVTVELDGSSKLTSGVRNAGLQKNASDSTGTLTIQDKDGTDGSLTVTGGFQAAGIGGSLTDGIISNGTANITITGGDITAVGGLYGAGIGSAHTNPQHEVKNDVTNITITGGKITATGGSGAAGIGGGYNGVGDVSGIHISGIKDSTITGGVMAAGIGGGAYQDPNAADTRKGGTVSDIRITDSDITVIAGGSGTGIGTGFGQNVGDDFVTIAGDSHITIKQSPNFQGVSGYDDDWNPTYFDYPDGTYIGTGSDVDRKYGANTPMNGTELDLDFPCLVPGSLTYVDKDGKTVKVIKGRDHQWDDGVVTTPASCFTDGVLTYTCKKCGAVKTEVIPAKGAHTWGEWETVKQPTTTETGLRQRVCGVCGVVEQEELPMLEPVEESTPVTDEDLWVTTLDDVLQKYDVRQNGTERVYTSHFDNGILTGSMETLQKLAEDGVETITFVTNQHTSSFRVDALLAAAGDGQLALRHEAGAVPVLTVGGTGWSALLF